MMDPVLYLRMDPVLYAAVHRLATVKGQRVGRLVCDVLRVACEAVPAAAEVLHEKEAGGGGSPIAL